MLKRNKTFLSQSHQETGNIAWYVSTDRGDQDFFSELVSSDLKISDCSGSISLDFSCEKPSHIDKRIDKIDTIIQELQSMKEGFLEAKKSLQRKYYY